MYNTDMPTRAELPSTEKLFRSTLIAAGVATTLLFTIVLPSEYGIDPTRVGRLLGLKKMGEIKVQLAKEAQREQPKVPQHAAAAVPAGPAEGKKEVERKDEMTLTLKPGQGAEIKLTMEKGAVVRYEWTSAGGPVNHDTHADGTTGQTHRYKKEVQVTGDKGELTAVFTGIHGWFWRNRGTSDVTITLRCSGAYTDIKRMA